MSALDDIKKHVIDGIRATYAVELAKNQILVNTTKPEFEGQYTVVLFALIKPTKSNPQALGESIGQYLIAHSGIVEKFNIVKGFLNLSISDSYWVQSLQEIHEEKEYGSSTDGSKKVVVEFSSPNTNKPLHLGHIRNILLGWSTANILEKVGHQVVRTQIVNDRGIAICKSMLAWKLFGEESSPESTGIKGDFFVGKYYVDFEKHFKKEYASWQDTEEAQNVFNAKSKDDQDAQAFFAGYKNNYFNEYSALGKQAKEMLIQWEEGNEEVLTLWNKMNSWVYAGFEETYKKLGIDFDLSYYESQTYIRGKQVVLEGLDNGIFYKNPDGSIWVDLEDVGLDKKIILRSDGTSVYLTQDLGTAEQRFDDHQANSMIYTVGDEQNYHFKVLFEIMKKMKRPYAEDLYHLSYGMVELPTGKMKSREGTVVDADELIAEVISEARKSAEERGDLSEISEEAKNNTFSSIGLAAIKFFMLKVNPKKRMVFDPKESVDMQGQTGPYIQNAYVRIRSIFRKNEQGIDQIDFSNYTLEIIEKEIIQSLVAYPEILKQAAKTYDPSLIANYCYNLAKQFHKFYHDVRILKAETEEAKAFRLTLADNVGKILASGFNLLGIEMPERM